MKVLKEPLVHFLILGALLYGYYAQKVQKPVIKSAVDAIYIQKDKNVSDVNLAFKVYNRVLLEEAYSLELEREDSYISSRLVTQMESILLADKRFEEPSEEKLFAYYEKNIEDYSYVDRLNFSYIHFNSLKDQELKRYLKIISIAPKREFKNVQKLLKQDRVQVIKRFGKYFARELFDSPSKYWTDAIHAKDGLYLVYIDKKIILNTLDFEDVEDRVYRDYKLEFMRDVKSQAYKNILNKYKIVVD